MDRKPKLQPIGNLTSRITSTQRAVGTMPDGFQSNPRGSATDASGTSRHMPIGTQHGEHGCGALMNSRTAMEIVGAAEAGDLQRDPGRLLTPSMQSALAATWDDDGAEDGYGWDGHVVRYEMNAPRSSNELALAIAISDAAMAPASEDTVLAELARLRAMTVSRDVGVDLQLVLACYADELMRYPADLVREVLRAWPRSQRFWPSMAELTERLERLSKPRRALRAGLRKGYQPPETSPDWIAPTADEKAAVDAYLDAHGFRDDPVRRERPRETEPMSSEVRRKLAEELKAFRLPDADDPRVLARLREMGAA